MEMRRRQITFLVTKWQGHRGSTDFPQETAFMLSNKVKKWLEEDKQGLIVDGLWIAGTKNTLVFEKK